MNMFWFSLCLDELCDLAYPETEYHPSLCVRQSPNEKELLLPLESKNPMSL